MIVAMGSSSGAIQALQTAFAPDDPGTSGNANFPSDGAAAIAISFGTQQNIDIGEPPIAMFHALDDTTAPFPLTAETCAQTTAMTNVCELFAYPDGGHGRFLLQAHGPEIVQQASEFLCRRVLGTTRCPLPAPEGQLGIG
jgi:hypothetical protein